MGCSPKLIEILEGGGKTIAKIANRIADECGATDAEFAEIVLKKDQNRRIRSRRRGHTEAPEEPKPDGGRKVVCIDEYGAELARYASIEQAATMTYASPEGVRRRCDGEMRSNEYERYGRTWRYADEWDAMTAAQRILVACDAKAAAWKKERSK